MPRAAVLRFLRERGAPCIRRAPFQADREARAVAPALVDLAERAPALAHALALAHRVRQAQVDFFPVHREKLRHVRRVAHRSAVVETSATKRARKAR